MKMNRVALTLVALAISSSSYAMSPTITSDQAETQNKAPHVENRMAPTSPDFKRHERLDHKEKAKKERGADHKKPNKHEMRQLMKERHKIVSTYIGKLSAEDQAAFKAEMKQLHKEAFGDKEHPESPHG